MSREDDNFSISELRKKRGDGGQAPTPAPASGGYGGGQFPPTNVGPSPASQLPQRRPAAYEYEEPAEAEEKSEFHVDKWRMLAALQKRWKWLVAAAAVMGLLGFAAGYVKGKYVGSIKLIKRDTVGGTEAFKPEALSVGTVTEILYSPDLIRRVAAKARPPISAEKLANRTRVEALDKTEFVRITIQGQNVPALVDLVNLYAAEAVDFSREFQIERAKRADKTTMEIMTKREAEVKRASEVLVAFQATNKVVNPTAEMAAFEKEIADTRSAINDKQFQKEIADGMIKSYEQELALHSPLAEKIAAEKGKLDDLLTRFTPNHPAVAQTVTNIMLLEARLKQAGTNPEAAAQFEPNTVGFEIQKKLFETRSGQRNLDKEITELEKKLARLKASATQISELDFEYIILKNNYDDAKRNLKTVRDMHRDALAYVDVAQGYYSKDPAQGSITNADVDTKPRLKLAIGSAGKGAMAGLIIVAALVLLVELKERTIKTAGEVEHVTGLKVLGALGDLHKMSKEEQERWAFRTWTIIAGQLSVSPSHGMVCGITSLEHGEGRSTWIRLLGNAASKRGLRVLTVATKPSGKEEPSTEAETAAQEKSFTEAVAEAMDESEAQKPAEDSALTPLQMEFDNDIMTLSPSALAFPAEVTQKFKSGDLPAAHIPLPGWVWDLDRRRQWQMALAHWRAIDNLVLLVELPPACVPEAVLLAESLPQLLWLVDSGKPGIRETKEHLEMMHHAKCQFVGAVLNHEPEPIIKL